MSNTRNVADMFAARFLKMLQTNQRQRQPAVKLKMRDVNSGFGAHVLNDVAGSLGTPEEPVQQTATDESHPVGF